MPNELYLTLYTTELIAICFKIQIDSAQIQANQDGFVFPMKTRVNRVARPYRELIDIL